MMIQMQLKLAGIQRFPVNRRNFSALSVLRAQNCSTRRIGCRILRSSIIVTAMNGRKDEPSHGRNQLRADDRVREPAVAGMFYPAEAEVCRAAAESYVAMWRDRPADSGESRGRWMGGVVPHAGWVCSGSIAGQTIGTIAASRKPPQLVSGLPHRPGDARAAGPTQTESGAPDVVIVLGAVHTPLPLRFAALDDYERWA